MWIRRRRMLIRIVDNRDADCSQTFNTVCLGAALLVSHCIDEGIVVKLIMIVKRILRERIYIRTMVNHSSFLSSLLPCRRRLPLRAWTCLFADVEETVQIRLTTIEDMAFLSVEVNVCWFNGGQASCRAIKQALPRAVMKSYIIKMDFWQLQRRITDIR